MSITKHFFVCKGTIGEKPPQGLSRSDALQWFHQQATEFAEKIKGQFPDVLPLQPTIAGPLIQITAANERALNNLVHDIGSAFNCSLVDAMTPIELIQ